VHWGKAGQNFTFTFTCYGTHLHRDESGSVDKLDNVPGMRLADPDPCRLIASVGRMKQGPYALDARKREAVLTSIREVCATKSWNLLAAHVRSSHVYVVVSCTEKPDKVMNAFKAYASRRLNQCALDEPDCRRWTRHGSTRYLWDREQVEAAVGYVIDGQGEPMALYRSLTVAAR
jgi:REP element-mobilizing transposase RayT